MSPLHALRRKDQISVETLLSNAATASTIEASIVGMLHLRLAL